jgi:hypothetical protein
MVRHTRRMKPTKRLNPKIDVPAELLGEDVVLAADVINDLINDNIPNTLREDDRRTLEDVVRWLRTSAKDITARDAQDWEATLATREGRVQRERDQRHAALHGVGEATVREAAIASRVARRVRRIA